MDRGDRFEMLVKGLEASLDFGKRVFLAASDSDVRRLVRMGAFVNVSGPIAPHAVHGSKTDHNHMQTFGELGFMAQSTCGVWTRSGFGDMARWWSKQHLHDCTVFL